MFIYRIERRRVIFYLFISCWLAVQTVYFSLTFTSIYKSPQLAYFKPMIGTGLAVAKASANVINLNSLLIILSMCRLSLDSLHRRVWFLDFIPWEFASQFHKLCSISIIAFSIVHAVAHYVNFVKLETSDLTNLGKLLFGSGFGITGHLLILSLLIIGITSYFKSVRRGNYELFWYLHRIIYFAYISLLSIHGSFCFIKLNTSNGIKCSKVNSWKWIIGPVLLYLFEQFCRTLRSFRKTIVSKVIAHPSQVLELQFKKPSMKFQQGQYVYICIPSVSYSQWHPFSITSIPQEGVISIHMRVCGDWTRKVSNIFGVDFQTDGTIVCLENDMNEPRVLIDGPFGDICSRIKYYKKVVLVGAGIGQTPFASVLKSLWYVEKY